MTTSPTHPPYSYSVKVSRRVRGVKIAIKPYKGLEVIVPPRFPQRQIAGILQQHAIWINRQLKKHQHSFETPALPDALDFALTGERKPIRYHRPATAKLREDTEGIVIACQQPTQVFGLLRGLVRKKARQVLPPMLQQIADELGFDFSKVSIRSQKTRWGSCSSSGAISLNDQLMFMPQDTVRYLMIHELCHTRHMNHSAAFWALVQHCCADFRQHDRQLAQGKDYVPDWFLHHLAGN